MHQLRRARGELVEVLAIERVDQIDFIALEAKHFDITIRLDVESNRIQIRQLASLLVCLPVIGISLQQHCGSGLVIGHHERPEYGHLLLGRTLRNECDLIELAIQSCHRSRKRNGNLGSRQNLCVYLARPGAECIACGRVQRGVHQSLNGVGNVFRRKWRPVGERDAAAQLERNMLAIF